MATFLDLVNSNSNPTPFGVNDRDDHFQSDADGLVTYIKRRLGDDIMSVELTNKQIYACFEEASLEYSKEINMHQAESHMSNLLGLDTGSLVSYKTNSDDKYIGTYKDNPKVGYTLAIDPYDNQFQTQPITEIIDLTDKIIHFKTKDEEYKLYLAKHFQEILEKFNLIEK